MENSTPISSAYFERRDIELGTDEIVVVSCMRNEYPRLSYFLKYYRDLGVTRFFMIDNASTDQTADFLKQQPDVEYFHTSASYRGSSSGRLWMQEIADTYAVDHWVLTLDVDELLVYPGIEELDLASLCRYLDRHGHNGLYTVLLDMYSDRPLSEAVYEPGKDFLDTCSYFETETYTIRPGANPPFLSIKGGPRGRLFAESGKSGSGPAMHKVPLVRWTKGFSYMYSTHSHRFVQLADINGALLHFKFFATFETLAATEASRGDRRQVAHYGTYQNGVDADLCFYSDDSQRYERPSDLVRLGVMHSSKKFRNHLASHFADPDPANRSFRKSDVRQAQVLLPEPLPAPTASLRAVHQFWPVVNNPSIAAYFGTVEPPAIDARCAFVHAMRKQVRVLDIRPDSLLLHLNEVALHRWRSSGLGLAVYADDTLVKLALIDGSDDSLTVDEDALEAGTYRLAVDLIGVGGPALRSRTITTYLVDGRTERFVLGAPDYRPAEDDFLIHTSRWYPAGGIADHERSFWGVLELLLDGKLRGWIYDSIEDRFDRPVAIYINGRFARSAVPDHRRKPLDRHRGGGRTPLEGRGFVVNVPLGFFKDQHEGDLVVEAYVAGTNLRLRRSPMHVPVGHDMMRWNPSPGCWQPADAAAETEPPQTRQTGRFGSLWGRIRSSGHPFDPTSEGDVAGYDADAATPGPVVVP